MGIVHISGKTRVGKTSLVVAVNIPLLNGEDDERYLQSLSYIKKLQAQGEKVTFPPQRHVVSANIDIKDTYPNVKAYKVSGFKLALPIKKTNKHYIPTIRMIPYGVYILDECAKYFKYKKLLPQVLRLYELGGQYHLLFYFISHRYIAINKDLRAIIDKFWYVTDCKHKYKINGKSVWKSKFIDGEEILETRWTYIEFEDEGDIELYLKSTSADKKKIGKRCHYRFVGDIRDHYDGYNFAQHFEKHEEDFNYSTSDEMDSICEPRSWGVQEGGEDD